MFSDTHFHFKLLTERGADGADILSSMAARNCFFGLDIGTEADDLQKRQKCASDAISCIKEPDLSQEIRARKERVSVLENCIAAAEKDCGTKIKHKKIIAVGECGLDRHWNSCGADGRNEADFDSSLLFAECELFEMQLDLAKRMNLPVIVHSRDAFEDTLNCIKNSSYDNGIIHCYSYGAAEAEAFLSRGWHISFSGSITYTKKSRIEETEQLIKIVPNNKLLCETDSPYLAPVPFRGKTNTPLLVEHVYSYAAKIRGTSAEELSAQVDKNIRALFGI